MEQSETKKMEPTETNMVSLRLRLSGYTVHQADVVTRGLEVLAKLGYKLTYEEPKT